MVNNIVEWLTCKEYLRKYFSDDQIKRAIENAGLTVEDLTEEKGYRAGSFPTWMKTCEIVKENHTFDTDEYKGEYKKRVTVNGWLIRQPNQYQRLKHGEIIEELLKERFEWFNGGAFMKVVDVAVKTEVHEFTSLRNVPEELRGLTVAELLDGANRSVSALKSKWKIFEPHRDDNDIYLECTGHETSLYVPFKALMECDWNAIVDRHVSYHSEYYKGEDRKHFLKEAMEVLDSFEAQVLKEKLEEEKHVTK